MRYHVTPVSSTSSRRPRREASLWHPSAVNISQPSISTAIAHLEDELGTQLFVRRHAQGLSLTSAGRLLLVEAKRLIEQAEYVYSVASEVGERVRGQLSLGCFITLAPMVMPELSHSFTSSYPESRIIQTVADHEQLLERLLSAELDVAITYDLLIPDEFEFLPLASLPPHVVVSEAGLWRDTRPSVCRNWRASR